MCICIRVCPHERACVRCDAPSPLLLLLLLLHMQPCAHRMCSLCCAFCCCCCCSCCTRRPLRTPHVLPVLRLHLCCYCCCCCCSCCTRRPLRAPHVLPVLRLHLCCCCCCCSCCTRRPLRAPHVLPVHPARPTLPLLPEYHRRCHRALPALPQVQQPLRGPSCVHARTLTYTSSVPLLSPLGGAAATAGQRAAPYASGSPRPLPCACHRAHLLPCPLTVWPTTHAWQTAMGAGACMHVRGARAGAASGFCSEAAWRTYCRCRCRCGLLLPGDGHVRQQHQVHQGGLEQELRRAWVAARSHSS